MNGGGEWECLWGAYRSWAKSITTLGVAGLPFKTDVYQIDLPGLRPVITWRAPLQVNLANNLGAHLNKNFPFPFTPPEEPNLEPRSHPSQQKSRQYSALSGWYPWIGGRATQVIGLGSIKKYILPVRDVTRSPTEKAGAFPKRWFNYLQGGPLLNKKEIRRITEIK